MKPRIVRYCKVCDKKMELLPCRVKNGWGVTCSRSCAMKLKPLRYWLGRQMTEEHRRKFSEAGKAKFINGYKQWNDGLRGWNSGEKNPMWKGGLSSLNARLRSSVDFKNWRKAVFARDNYVCQHCNARSREGKRLILNADHIKPWALYPQLRFDVSNGRTLCIDCHKKTETYGRKLNNALYNQ